MALELMRNAVVEARAQTCALYELKSLVALCSRDDASPQDYAALKIARLNLREGFDLPLAKRAMELTR